MMLTSDKTTQSSHFLHDSVETHFSFEVPKALTHHPHMCSCSCASHTFYNTLCKVNEKTKKYKERVQKLIKSLPARIEKRPSSTQFYFHYAHCKERID